MNKIYQKKSSFKTIINYQFTVRNKGLKVLF